MQRELEEIVVRMMKEFTNFYLLRSALLTGLLKIFLIYLSRKFSNLSHDPAISDRDVQCGHRTLQQVFQKKFGHELLKLQKGDEAVPLKITL
jgi:hypothetical protein